MVMYGLRLYLKLFNTAMGLGGIATIIYGILMLRVWQLEKEGSSSHHHITVPWCFHAFVGVGIALCAITCLGHIAANTTNICWLSTVSNYQVNSRIAAVRLYIMIILFLLVLETVIMADLFVNPNWQKELPVSLSDRYDDFMDFVGSYDFIWKCLAWSIFLTQAVCILLAALRIQVTNEVDSDESEDEYPEPALPLLGPSARREQADPSIV